MTEFLGPTDTEIDTDAELSPPADAAAETDGLEAHEDAGGADEAASAELEDIEHEGKTYQVPRALKGAFLRQADYTRKTQELAAERRALESARDADGEAMHMRAGLAAIEQRLTACDDIDWDQFQRLDPQGAMQLRGHLEDLAAGHAELSEQLADWDSHQTAQAEQSQMTRLQAGHSELTRDVPGWSPQLADRLSDFAMREFGVSEDELEQVDDPRLVKLLHAAYVGANSGRLNRQAQRLADAQTSRPATTVHGRASAGKNPNRMSTDEWMRHRNAQLHRQR